jgi:Lrp/AsnC family transcriptional regulator, leucine-responsive regulatory protein
MMAHFWMETIDPHGGKPMDSIDITILEHLMSDGRATWAALGEATGLSPAALAQRVRRLERDGVILGYAARLDPDAVGAGLLAFVSVRFYDQAKRDRFLTLIRTMPWVQECHHVTGEMEYLLKVRCSGTRALERLITDELMGRCKVAETRTSIVLATAKETTALAVGK